MPKDKARGCTMLLVKSIGISPQSNAVRAVVKTDGHQRQRLPSKPLDSKTRTCILLEVLVVLQGECWLRFSIVLWRNTEEEKVMLSETDRERMRRAFHLENKSIRQIAQEEGCSRDTVRRALALDPLQPCQLTHPKPAPVLGPYQSRIEALLHQNQWLPRKQRYTSHRIFEVLRDEEGYRGSESTIRHAISIHKHASRKPDVFLPLEFEPGQDAQVDWGEAVAEIGGQRQKVQ